MSVVGEKQFGSIVQRGSGFLDGLWVFFLYEGKNLFGEHAAIYP